MRIAKVVAGLVWMAAVGRAQTVGFTPRADADKIPSYELVSIHKTPEIHGGNGINDVEDGMRASATSLRSLIAEAYGFSIGELSDQQLVGGPEWVKSQLFDVQAKVDPASVEKLKALSKAETMMVTVRDMSSRTPTFRMLMLQRLLEERFKLKIHYEQRVMSLYEVTVAKGGVRMKTAHPENPESGTMQMSNGVLKGDNVPISFIPLILALELERPVVDKTRAAGNFDFELHWSRMGDGGDNGGDASAPSLFTAVQEQMGLKLNAAKGPVWVIVVDHAEMPSEN